MQPSAEERGRLLALSALFLLAKQRELRRGGKVSSVGGGRTAPYTGGIAGRLNHLLSPDIVEGKFAEAKRFPLSPSTTVRD
jgi:hypothetical protein